MPETARRGPSSRATRDKLTRAAAELIAEQGWGRVTTRAVAERAGLPHGAVSYHFRGKQELLIEACLDAFAHAVPLEELAALSGLGEVVDMIADQLDQELRSTTTSSRLMFEAMREAERDESLRERLGVLVADYRTAVAAAVRADQSRGRLPASVSPDGVAALLAAVGDGLLLHAILGAETDVPGALAALRTLLASSDGG